MADIDPLDIPWLMHLVCSMGCTNCHQPIPYGIVLMGHNHETGELAAFCSNDCADLYVPSRADLSPEERCDLPPEL